MSKSETTYQLLRAMRHVSFFPAFAFRLRFFRLAPVSYQRKFENVIISILSILNVKLIYEVLSHPDIRSMNERVVFTTSGA